MVVVKKFLLLLPLVGIICGVCHAESDTSSDEDSSERGGQQKPDKEPPKDFYIRKGDMLIVNPKYELQLMQQQSRAGIIGQIDPNTNQTIVPNRKWPNNVIPYQWNIRMLLNFPMQRKITKAMKDIEKAVPNCFKFQQKSLFGPRFKNWVTFQTHQPGCFSSLGNQVATGVHNTANFNRICPQGSIVHELLHTLGFHHEQTRNDRDEFVTIHYDNIKPNAHMNYWKNNEVKKDAQGRYLQLAWNTSYYDIPYNYESIMHYPISGGDQAIDTSKPIMTNLKNSKGLGADKEPGQRQYLSSGDLLMIARHGGCKIDDNPKPYPVSDANPEDTADEELTPRDNEEPDVNIQHNGGTELRLDFSFKDGK